jgi:flagellar protein FliS
VTAVSTPNPFLADSVLTASPERLLIMLYDRLALDLVRGERAIAARDTDEVHKRLTNAQAIVTELRTELDVTIWPEGASLIAVYDYIIKLLVDANIYKDATKVAEARALVAPLHDAWKTVAGRAITSNDLGQRVRS